MEGLQNVEPVLDRTVLRRSGEVSVVVYRNFEEVMEGLRGFGDAPPQL